MVEILWAISGGFFLHLALAKKMVFLSEVDNFLVWGGKRLSKNAKKEMPLKQCS